MPANAGGLAELLRGVSGLGSLDSEQLLGWVDHFGEASLAARLGFVLEAAALGDDLRLLYELERRRPRARVYLEPGTRGGRLVSRWNVIVPGHLRPASLRAT